MGPCIVSVDEFSFPPKIGISCLVNGDVRQESNTENLIAGIADIIHSECIKFAFSKEDRETAYNRIKELDKYKTGTGGF